MKAIFFALALTLLVAAASAQWTGYPGYGYGYNPAFGYGGYPVNYGYPGWGVGGVGGQQQQQQQAAAAGFMG